MENGIFADLRRKNYNLSDGSFVNITTPNQSLTWELDKYNYFCHYENVIASPPYSVVDGLSTTAWAPYDDKSENDKYLIFDFYETKVYVHSFSLQTLCQSPNKVTLEGSIDKGASWSPFCNSNVSFPEYNITNVECEFPNTFQMFKLTQIGKNSNGKTYRFHIYNLEFYGKIIKNNIQISCDHSSISFTISFILVYYLK